MNKLFRKVILGLFISTFFFRLGFCLVFSLVFFLLRSVNSFFLPLSVSFLLFDLIVSVIETVKCILSMKRTVADPDVQNMFDAVTNSDTPYEDMAKALEPITGNKEWPYDDPDNKYAQMAERIKAEIKDGMTAKEATAVFIKISEEMRSADEKLSYDALVGTRYSDGKTYYVLNFNLVTEGASLSFNMLFRHSFWDPKTNVSIQCDGDRRGFYKDVFDNSTYLRLVDSVPEHIDVLCGK